MRRIESRRHLLNRVAPFRDLIARTHHLHPHRIHRGGNQSRQRGIMRIRERGRLGCATRLRRVFHDVSPGIVGHFQFVTDMMLVMPGTCCVREGFARLKPDETIFCGSLFAVSST